MDADLDIPALNRRAESFGLSVVHDDPEIMPTSEAGVPFRFNMGRGAYCRLLARRRAVAQVLLAR